MQSQSHQSRVHTVTPDVPPFLNSELTYTDDEDAVYVSGTRKTTLPPMSSSSFKMQGFENQQIPMARHVVTNAKACAISPTKAGPSTRRRVRSRSQGSDQLPSPKKERIRADSDSTVLESSEDFQIPPSALKKIAKALNLGALMNMSGGRSEKAKKKGRKQ